MASPSTRNRLSIAHLLLWMLVTSVLFAIHAQDYSLRSEFLKSIPNLNSELARQLALDLRISIGIQLASLPLLAMGIVGVAQGALRRNREYFPSAPGHWLLVAVGWVFIALEVNFLIVYALSQRDPRLVEETFWRLHSLWRLIEFVGAAIATGTLCVGLCHCRDGRIWTLVVALFATAMFFLAINPVSLLIQSFSALPFNPLAAITLGIAHATYLAGSLAMIAGCLRDWRLHASRDFFHFAGIVVVVALIVGRLSGEISRLIVQ